MQCTNFRYLCALVPILLNLLLDVLYNPGSFLYILSVLLLRVYLFLNACKFSRLYTLCISCKLCRGKLLACIWTGPPSLSFSVVGM